MLKQKLTSTSLVINQMKIRLIWRVLRHWCVVLDYKACVQSCAYIVD